MSELVEEALDLSAIRAAYTEERGYPPYDPRLMVKLLSGFGRRPRVVYRDGDFVALNYTAGRWDGWTPFETVNDVGDLRRAERFLLARGRPGWLLGTLDTCPWAFSGELCG